MSVVVTGCGRSGTNVALEILSGNPYFTPTEHPEDKKVFLRTGHRYHDQYLTKCDTCYYTALDLRDTKTWNPSMKFVWCLRDPRDMAMSKFYRGRPKSEGGDCAELADDATVSGMLTDIDRMACLYRYMKRCYPLDMYVLRMEDSINDPYRVAKALCGWYGIVYHDGMAEFWRRMRNKQKRERYGNTLDKSQVQMYKRWDTVYDGWFKDCEFDGSTILGVFEMLKPYCEEFGYEV